MIKTLFTALFGSIIGGGSVWLWIRFGTKLYPESMSYSDLAATLLTAVSVLLAILAFFIAILAFFGWTQFREMAANAAKNEIQIQMDGGSLKNHFEQMLQGLFKAHLKTSEFRRFMRESLDRASFGGFQETIKGEGHDDDLE